MYETKKIKSDYFTGSNKAKLKINQLDSTKIILYFGCDRGEITL